MCNTSGERASRNTYQSYSERSKTNEVHRITRDRLLSRLHKYTYAPHMIDALLELCDSAPVCKRYPAPTFRPSGKLLVGTSRPTQ